MRLAELRAARIPSDALRVLRLDDARRGRKLGGVPRQPSGVIGASDKALGGIAEKTSAQLRAKLARFLKLEHIDQATAKDIRELLASPLGGEISEKTARVLASRLEELTSEHNYRDVARTIGIRVPEFSAKIGQVWRDEQVALITSISGDARERIAAHLAEVGERGMRVETFRKRLQESEDMSYRRARLVARDQVLSLNAKLTQDRHERAGITSYKWLCVGSPVGMNTRQNHWALNGKIFRYDDPPLGGGTGPDDYGNPGDGIGCRCQSIPILD